MFWGKCGTRGLSLVRHLYCQYYQHVSSRRSRPKRFWRSKGVTLAARTSCLARHLVRAASKPMRSPRGVTLASVQLSSLPDASSPAPLPQRHERGNIRTRVLPLQSHSTTLRGQISWVNCKPCPNKHLNNWTLVSLEVNVVAAVFSSLPRGRNYYQVWVESFLTPSKSLFSQWLSSSSL